MSFSFVLSHQTASTYRNVRLGGLIPCGLAEGHFEQPCRMLKKLLNFVLKNLSASAPKFSALPKTVALSMIVHQWVKI
jgi:hypothetical protein